MCRFVDAYPLAVIIALIVTHLLMALVGAGIRGLDGGYPEGVIDGRAQILKEQEEAREAEERHRKEKWLRRNRAF